MIKCWQGESKILINLITIFGFKINNIILFYFCDMRLDYVQTIT